MFNASTAGIEEPIGASMAWSLDQGHLELRPVFDFRSPNAGLYGIALNFGCIKIDQKSSFLDTAGFGVLHSPPRNSPSDTTQSMQFLAIYGPQNISDTERSIGLYYGVHDPKANSKDIDSYLLGNNAAFTYTATPPNANEGNMLHELDYPIRIVPFEGDWYDAS